MKSRLITKRAAAVALAGAIAAICGACRKADSADPREQLPQALIAPELMTNQLGTLPGAVYKNQARSPIRWQPWTEETLEHARNARRLVFCVVAMPQHSAFLDILSALESDVTIVNELNDGYVPVLLDADAAREFSILTSDLCAEIRQPVGLPLFLWMTHEANPVAWIPMFSEKASKISEMFLQSHTMISQMWRDDPGYVISNSRLDNESRRARFEARKNVKVMSEKPAEDLLQGLRQLASLYDPLSRNFDETGGLFPASTLELLASASVNPGLHRDLRDTCLATTRNLLKDLLGSPMFDPLDGGVFSGRRGASWTLPNFAKDCITHGRVAKALIEAYRATGEPLALERALGLIAFAEENYAAAHDLFAIGLTPPTPPEAWLWSVEDIGELLGPEDAQWWIQATGMKGLGNLPSEVDPRREYFRANTLALNQNPAQIAASSGFNPQAFESRFQAARATLLDARKARIGRVTRDDSPNPSATLRMVSAYAAAFQATGDEAYREKALRVLRSARERFTDGRFLRAFVSDAPATVAAGRTSLYALSMQAALDVAAITSDESWLIWAEDLATTAAELFSGEELLKECPDSANLINLPVTDLVMLFDDSTAGLISMAECRLAELGRPLVRDFSKLATPLPTYARERPVLHTDLFHAALARHYGITVVHGGDLTPEWKHAIERLPPRTVHRRQARAGESIAPGVVELRFGPDGRKVSVASPEALARAILPVAEAQDPSPTSEP
ncbi:MAG: DUF255 domain-containing protein [Luteolibacter sp.]